MPKDVLELGKYLVRELVFEEGVNTLGRWMSHHLAELINEAENAPTAQKRLRAQKKAIDTILRIWDHRASLPGKAYPLKTYKDTLKILDLLKPDRNPFNYFLYHNGTKRDQLAAGLFDGLTRIIIAVLLMKIEPTKRVVEVDPAVFRALSETEQHVLTALHEWGDLFEVVDKKATGRRRKGRGEEEKKVNLDEAILQLIDEEMTSLVELRREIIKNNTEVKN